MLVAFFFLLAIELIVRRILIKDTILHFMIHTVLCQQLWSRKIQRYPDLR